jgi:hypothetical protein
MKKNSTSTGRCIVLLTIFSLLSIFSANAGKGPGHVKAPKFKFSNPKLVSGIDGQIGAKYLFTNVYNNKDAYITIEDIVGGAVLKDMDNTSTGYPEAWQPTVGGPGINGMSYIKWNVEFDSADVPYVFSLIDLSAIDVDGDNSRVRELSGIVGSNLNYSVPDSLIPSLLTLSSIKNTDDVWGTDDDDSAFLALGPVANRLGIDTLAFDVRIDYTFANRSSFQIYTGSQVEGNSGALATDRFHSIYFGDLTGSLSVLPVIYESFNAILNNNSVSLNWTTSADITNDQFEVEKSFDQSNFETSGLVLGAQSINDGIAQFSFKDMDKEILNHDIIYYRLKQANANGKYTYSVVKAVRISHTADQKMDVQVMPNPYMDKLNVNFTSDNNGKAEIRMISLSGAVVKKTESTIIKGSNNIQLQDLSSQLPGMYVVNILVNGQSIASQKIIKN